jgi:hypothetical protein
MKEGIEHLLNSDKPIISKRITTYSQNPDTCSKDIVQNLTIETEDGGNGIYYIISTDKWAFDKIEEVIDILNNFVKENGKN